VVAAVFALLMGGAASAEIEYGELTIDYSPNKADEIPQQEIDVKYQVSCRNDRADRYIVAVVDSGDGFWVQGHRALKWTEAGSKRDAHRYTASGTIHIWVGARVGGEGTSVKIAYYVTTKDLLQRLRAFPAGKAILEGDFEALSLEEKAEQKTGWRTLTRRL